MTNKQYPVIEAIKVILATITSLRFIGEYPDDLSKIGQRFPAVIIEDSDETYDIFAGNVYKTYMDIYLHVYSEIIIGKTKMEKMLDLQAEINDAILADLTLSGTVVNIRLTEVTKETEQNTAGQQINHRRIKYNVEIHDTRV